MYDSGSQKSYIRKEMVSALRLAPLRQQHLSHVFFEGERINEKLHNVYKIELGSLYGSFNSNFDVVDQDIICNDVPSVSYGPWIEELKSMNIEIRCGKDNIPWDREVEDNLKLEFLKWFEELISLTNLSVSRCFSPVISGQQNLSIHTFCYASQLAYAAAVLVHIEYSGVVHVNLLDAKSRVAPVKTVTIPHQELLAATVGAQLCRSVLSALHWDNMKQN
ncbi:DUF1758 domain-containing protein [Nephila pilipes]|uniref:DUF1758 domain-containing protein n=1 Tax=Nephila pilipes TaxID=299642 RepID=A0A8X6I7H4_NEPPI|nr:DUF1758 domain-containing protein [Nephila pilipes]